MIGWMLEDMLHKIAAFFDTNAINDEFWDGEEDDIY